MGLITNFAFGSKIQLQGQSFPINSELDDSILGGLGQGREQVPVGQKGIQISDPHNSTLLNAGPGNLPVYDPIGQKLWPVLGIPYLIGCQGSLRFITSCSYLVIWVSL